jgi:L-threonylcarbamoyladenylate synthase
VAFPTETVYGLGANALREDAAIKVYQAKGRPSDNPLIIHLAFPEEAEDYCVTNSVYYDLASRFMPGPLTVILPKKDIIPQGVTGGLQTVAVRIPSHPIAHSLIQYAGVPIAAPSANLSGRPSCTCARHVAEDMDGRIDVILDGGESEIGLESTIVSIQENQLTLLRPGGITQEMLVAAGFHLLVDKAVTQKLADSEKPLAPGMKYRHYAPNAQVILLDGTDRSAESFMLEHLVDPSVAVIAFDEYTKLQNKENVWFCGSLQDTNFQAHRLFDILRNFDSISTIKTIYAKLPSKDGLGFAIYNRMLKASGYTILKV